MLSLIIAAVVLAVVVYMLLKGWYPQAALFFGGFVLLLCTWIFGLGEVLPAKSSTNFTGFDIFKVFGEGFATRVKGLGLQLMAIGGFSRYMEHVGASNALFEVFKKPLSMIKSPYILLGAAFLVSQVMAIFVPSHAGLALLLMVTLYPLLVRSGVSQMSALGMIGCAQYVDAGPGSGNCNMAAQVAGMDVSEYFVYYQLPLFVAVTLIVCVTHMIVRPEQHRDARRFQGFRRRREHAEDLRHSADHSALPDHLLLEGCGQLDSHGRRDRDAHLDHRRHLLRTRPSPQGQGSVRLAQALL